MFPFYIKCIFNIVGQMLIDEIFGLGAQKKDNCCFLKIIIKNLQGASNMKGLQVGN
jgi:hypothetical protein